MQLCILRFYYVAAGSSLAAYMYVNEGSYNPFVRPHKAFSLLPEKLELSDALCETVTKREVLEQTKDSMKTKMEAYVTNLQGQIVKSLQAVEPDAKFVVDRWERKEVKLEYYVFLVYK